MKNEAVIAFISGALLIISGLVVPVGGLVGWALIAIGVVAILVGTDINSK